MSFRLTSSQILNITAPAGNYLSTRNVVVCFTCFIGWSRGCRLWLADFTTFKQFSRRTHWFVKKESWPCGGYCKESTWLPYFFVSYANVQYHISGTACVFCGKHIYYLVTNFARRDLPSSRQSCYLSACSRTFAVCLQSFILSDNLTGI